MCGFRNSYAAGPAGIYDADEALGLDALEDETGRFTDEDFADEPSTLGAGAVEPTEHFDLTVEQQSIIAGALSLVSHMLASPSTLELSIQLGLINKVAVQTMFIRSDADTVDWPPTADEVGRVGIGVSELGLSFITALQNQLTV